MENKSCEKEITLKQVEDALEEAWDDYPYKEELLTDNLLRIYHPDCGCLIINKNEWYDEFVEMIKSYKNKEDE